MYRFTISMKYYFLILLSSSSLLLSQKKTDLKQLDRFLEIRQSLNYFTQVYTKVNHHFVDEINSREFIKSGIQGMLSTLDPYTELLEEDDNKRMQIITTGEYGGIGIEITQHEYGIMIANVVQNSPASKNKIIPGSIIAAVDHIDTKNKNLDEVSKLLKGNIGDELRLELYNPFTKESKLKVLKRDIIKLLDVPYFGMLRKNIAYLKLTGFTENAPHQVKSAIEQLKEHFVFDKLIIDLRDNPGGLLESARQIVNLFVDKGEIIVSTKGKNEGQINYYANEDPSFPNLKLAILVNENTASAAEIVSGALQDLDKAIVLGTETFGKGLVQKIFTLDPANSIRVKVTTSKYYTPSGRCIQRSNIFRNKSIKTKSKPETFHTRNGRVVYDASGVQPDININAKPISPILIELEKQRIIFDFAIEIINKNKNFNRYEDLNVINFDDFKRFYKSKKFNFRPEGSQELDKMINLAKKNNYSESLIHHLNQSRLILEKHIEKLINENKSYILNAIYNELSEKKWGLKGKYYSMSKNDPLILRALDVLKDNNSFKKILAYH